MNLIFAVMAIISLIVMTVIDPENAYSAMLGGAENAISLAFKLAAIYCIWLSVLDIMEKTNINKLLYKIFSPLTKLLFKKEDEKTQELISMNFSANLLGMGGAATPLGIKAMERMNGDNTKASDNAILFMVINATSIQLLPANIIGIRASACSVSESDIIIPSLIATSVATAVGVILCLVLRKKK